MEQLTMAIEEIKKLQRWKSRLTTVLNELETLEDGVDVDYSEIITDLGYITVMLEQRRERLQRRGRTQ
jgi:hypothetical protein